MWLLFLAWKYFSRFFVYYFIWAKCYYNFCALCRGLAACEFLMDDVKVLFAKKGIFSMANNSVLPIAPIHGKYTFDKTLTRTFHYQKLNFVSWLREVFFIVWVVKVLAKFLRKHSKVFKNWYWGFVFTLSKWKFEKSCFCLATVICQNDCPWKISGDRW